MGHVRRFGHLPFFFARPKLLEVTIVNIFKGKALLDDGDGSTTGRNDEQGRRSKASTFLPTRVETPGPLSCKLIFRDDVIWVALGDEAKIRLLRRNTAQCKIVLLTLLDAKLLSFAQVAQALGLSEERTRKLRKALIEEDVNAVLDKRRGQQREYLVTPEVKSELIQQFVANALSGWPTSGRAIAEELQERCEIEVSERSVRLYVDKLGLSNIKETLPMLLESQKKRSSNS